MNTAELLIELRRYARTEHGKRSRIHAHIVHGIFQDPEALAAELSDILNLAAKAVAMGNPEETKRVLREAGLI